MTLPWRLALRDLRGGLGGLRLLIACLFLGVGAIAGVGSLSASILTALAAQGQDILGGDVAVEMSQRRASPEERAAFEALGDVSELVLMRANVATADNSETIIAELKAVDTAYPLYGQFRLRGGGDLQNALEDGLLLGTGAAERLGVRIGDRLRVGEARLPLTGIIENEPDKVAEGFVIGPTVMIGLGDFARTGLERAGSLYEVQYRIRAAGDLDLEEVEEDLLERFPDGGLDVDTRDNAAPGARRFILNVGQFLTLVGLTALIVAGVGVGSGVSSYLRSKTRSIASLKSIGAGSKLIFRTYMIQIGLVTFGAVLAGAVVGALVPSAVSLVAGEVLPVPPAGGIYPLPLLTAILYGFLTAFAFAVWPLLQARDIPAARLFRAGVETAGRPPASVLGLMFAAGLLVAVLAVVQARQPLFAAGFLAAAMATLLLLGLIAGLIVAAARALPRPRHPLFRLAIANLTRPGGMTRQLTVSLGLGLTLFAVLGVIETNLSGQIERTIPEEAPTHFLLDIPAEGETEFRDMVSEAGGAGTDIRTVPSLRGAITAVDGKLVSEMEEIPEGAWILRGDRGLTFASEIPEGNRIVSGEWWPADYDGPQLLSMDAEVARTLGLEVGDTLTVNIFGFPLTAEIANLREIDWATMGFNFGLVYSPGEIEEAPYSLMATIRVPDEGDRLLTRRVGDSFPSSSIIRVSDVLDSAETVLGQLSAAIRAASAVAILAGIAVLVGAIAAARRARTYDAVMLKVLGATRPQILLAFLIEFAILSAVVAGLALALGAAGGWFVITQVFDLEWLPDWGPVVAVVLAGASAISLLSLVGNWSALRARPAQALRAL
ncbi:ABC transporter permease [Pacificimonas flava]|uniref:ABC transporter permease n=2 Tax=Pacificimonas TaxID=1960290 RepID=A0A219B4Z0_9SPHN|nr:MULTISPECIES: FtsX-like permease family protein [Pacificimonas]MBZ6379562.1 ABC transporter permease [Pacificimonas aurantium]OWV33254.1 ABC transporter permease [Pacificimonas flava]